LTSISLLTQNRVELMRMRQKSVFIITNGSGQNEKELMQQLAWVLRQAF